MSGLPPTPSNRPYLPMAPEEGHGIGRWIRSLVTIILLLMGWALALLAIGIPGAWIPSSWYIPPDQPMVPDVRRIRFHPFEGWIFENVLLHLRGRAGPPFARVERLTFEWKPGAWTSHGRGIDTIQIRNGSILLPLESTQAINQGKPFAVFQWQGRLVVEHLDLWGQKIHRADGFLRVEGNRIQIEGMVLECEGPSGERAVLRGGGNLDLETGRTEGRFQWHGDPMAISRFMTVVRASHAVLVFQRFRHGPWLPSGEAEFEGRLFPPGEIRFLSTAQGRDGSWGLLPYEQFFLRVRYEKTEAGERRVQFEPLVWLTPQAIATANLDINLSNPMIRADGFFSGDPTGVLSCFSVWSNSLSHRVRFEGPVRVQGSVLWMIGCNRPQTADLRFGMERVAWGEFLFDRVAGRFEAENAEYRIPEIRADCLGGVVTGRLSFVLGKKIEGVGEKQEGTFLAEGGASGVDLRRLARELRPGWEGRSMGELSGRFAVRGFLVPDWPRKMEGEGSVRIREGLLFRVPFFGFVTEWIARLIPGLDIKLSQTEAAADWHVSNGRVTTENLWINGEWVSVSVRGGWEMSDELDGYAQIKLLKAESLLGKTIRTITWPLSKLFEFRVRGSLSSPRWYPTNFSMDLFERLGMKEEGGSKSSSSEPEERLP